MSERIGVRLSLALALGYVFAAAVLIAALAYSVEPLSLVWLSPRRLPGFNLSVPGGEVDHESIAYPVGRFTVHTAPAAAAIIVRWDPQFGNPEDLTDRFADSARAQGGSSERMDLMLADGRKAPLWHMRIGSDVWISIVSCGARQIRITTSASLRGSERLHRRIVASLRCHPDAAAEADVGDVPLVLQLPPAYHRVLSPPGHLVLTSDRKMVMAQIVAGQLTPEAGAKEMEAAGVLGPGVHVGAREGTQFSVESETGDELYGWTTTLACRASGLSIWLTAVSRISRDDAREGQEILRQARCRAPAEPPQAWP
jgi:hypothetical protein